MTSEPMLSPRYLFVRRDRRGWSLLTALLAVVLFTPPVDAQDDDDAQADRLPIGQFVTIKGGITQGVSGNVRNIALDLNQQAVSGQEPRKAYLVVEVHDGASEFGAVRDLAKFLRSERLSNVTTVAWVPQVVTGNNVVIALACDEIVMHPKAALGDIGRGQAVDADDSRFVMGLVERKHNVKLSPALVEGMLDPKAVVLKATITETVDGQARTETRTLTAPELDALSRNPDLEIANVQRIKERGVAGLYTGTQARAEDILIVHLAESRDEVVDLYNLPRESLRESGSEADVSKARLIAVDEEIDAVLSSFLIRQIDRARASGSKLIIFDLQARGGIILPSLDLATRIRELEESDIRTVAYVPGEVFGGAALVALACDDIYMKPSARLGQISASTLTAEEDETVELENLQRLRESLTALAEAKQRPAGVYLAMMDSTLELYQVTNIKTGRVSFMTEEELANTNGEWIKGPVVPETTTEEALVIDGNEAQRMGIAEAPVADFDEVKLRIGIPADVDLNPIGRTWVDSVVFWLNTPTATTLLFVLGSLLIYLELQTMTGACGIGSALCFALFFWSRFLGGTSGWLEVTLFALGIICVLMEIFVIPGFGIFGISGGLLVFTSLVMASQTFGNFEPDADYDRMANTLGTLTASIVSVVVVGAVMSRYLPQMPILNQMILSPPSMGIDPNSPQFDPANLDGPGSLIGRYGQAVSILRPAGKADIEGEYVDVISDGGYIDQGAAIEVIRVDGNRVFVRQV